LAFVNVIFTGADEGLRIKVEFIKAGQVSDAPLSPLSVELAIVVRLTAGLLQKQKNSICDIFFKNQRMNRFDK
jgi:hypothetical protein